jgi:archaellum component FlaC
VQEFLTTVLYPTLFAFLGIAVTKFWDWVKPKFQTKIDNAEARAKEIDNEIKSADFYKTLLDDLKVRLEFAIQAIEERDVRIAERDKKIEERDKKIDHLLSEVELLTDELRKFKQLNGKP